MLLIAVGVDNRTLSGDEEEQFHHHIATCDACRALTLGTEHDRPRRIARSSAEPVSTTDLPTLPAVDPGLFAKGDVLARGGMGRITRARDRRLGRDVALKEVLAPELRARFEREAKITARLQHPAIVPVYEAGTWPDGSVFYAMRLVAGGTLADAIDRASTVEARVALLPHVVALTEALAYAHARRVVHRDLKPANVLVDEFGETVVIDWGLAKELDRDAPEPAAAGSAGDAPELTRAGAVVGTPCFLAPEQAAGEPVDERADVYSLGAILYHLLAGHPPYWDSVEHSADRLVAAAVLHPPTPLRQIAPGAPADLRAIAERAMARDRTARFPTAKDMADELRRFETGQLLRSREYGLRELIARRIRQHRAAVTVGAIAVGVLAVSGAVAVQRIVAGERETRHALAEAQLERGRQLVVDGDPAQAAAYLAAALGEIPDDPVALRLAAIALRDVDRWLDSFPGTAAAFRADGGELAIGQADGSIVVVDPRPHGAAERPRRMLATLGGPIAALAYSARGTQLGVATRTAAYLCDAQTGAARRITDEPASEVASVPGDRFAFATEHAVILVGADGSRLASAPADHPFRLALSGDGAHLAALVDGGAVAWRTTDLAQVDQAAGTDWFAATAERGHLITAGMDGVRRWDTPAGAQLRPDPSGSLAWAGDHTLLANCAILDVATGGVRPLGHNEIQNSTVIDARHAITSGFDRRLRIWDLERPSQPIAVLEAADAAHLVRVDPAGHRAISRGGAADARIELWDVANVQAAARTANTGVPVEGVLSSHRDRIAVQQRGYATLLMTATLESIAQLDGMPFAFRPESDELLTGRNDAPAHYALRRYSSRDGAQLGTLPCPDASDQAWIGAFSRDGAATAIGCERSLWVREHDGDPWRAVERAGSSLALFQLALDDRGHLFTGHADGALRIWDRARPAGAETPGNLLVTQRGHDAAISSLEIRGDTAFTFSRDQTLRQWAIPSGEPRGRAYARFDDAAMSPNGLWIATVDTSPDVSLWDSARARLLAKIPAAQPLLRVAFLDDDHVVAAGQGGYLEVVDVSGPPRTAPEVIRRVGDSPRWRVENRRVVERL